MKPYAVDFHVKIRGPNQGLGSIPASKNEALGFIPESIKCYSGTDLSEYLGCSGINPITAFM